MNEKDLPTGSGEEFESDPDTNTDEPEGGEETTPRAPEVEPVQVSEEPDEIPMAPPASTGPRVFKEHYMLLLGMAMVLASTLSVWYRPEVYGGHILTGAMSIKRTFLMGLALYGVAVGISNIAVGRLKGMGSAFITGVVALWLGIKGFLAFNSVDGFMGWSEMEKYLKDHGGSNFQILLERYLGQWGPGVWMSTIGGGIIVFVFLKAIFGGGGKKTEAAPPPPQRRRGRR